MVLAQTAIAIERTVASISLHEYEHQGKHLGILLTLAVLFTTITACLWLFSTDNPAELQIACGSFSDATFAKANFLYTSLLFIDTFNLTAYIMIWSRNKQLCKKSAYVTRVKYQIQENLYVLGMVFPIALSHFIVFGFDMGFLLLLRSQKENLSLKLYRTLSMLGYVIPFFTIILPITIITIEYRTQAKRRRILASTVNVDSTGEVYFRSLQLQWAQC
ncbi:unnamed protein product, partial [Mesorhabditis belari]|uniref:Uncharacterized protein n=1 Tax=Mesorhabditis belari TaxID=2138241 RepID=A0AAF3EE34_9BILA